MAFITAVIVIAIIICTFKTQDGKEVEARLGEFGTSRFNKGDSVRIKYLPGKTDYVLPELR
jgi:hypothetical protein